MRRRLYNKRMTVSTFRVVEDGMGGWSETGLPAGGIIPCRCEAISGAERQIWRQEGVDISHRLYCAADAGLTAMQTVDIDGTEYDVRFVRERGGRTKHIEADLTERRHDTN
jgi:SPP1 family predicted phage head-tail adaptor